MKKERNKPVEMDDHKMKGIEWEVDTKTSGCPSFEEWFVVGIQFVKVVAYYSFVVEETMVELWEGLVVEAEWVVE